MKSRDLDGPRSQFQATEFAKEDIGKLVRDINKAAGEKRLSTERIQKSFATCWPELDRSFSALKFPEGQTTKAPTPSPNTNSGSRADLDAAQIEMLQLVAEADDNRLFPERAAAALGIHPQRAKFILETLQAAGLLTPSHNYLRGTSWVLNPAGRAELVRRELI
jgi:hypothetical protein